VSGRNQAERGKTNLGVAALNPLLRGDLGSGGDGKDREESEEDEKTLVHVDF
jgi:hypothetical protein